MSESNDRMNEGVSRRQMLARTAAAAAVASMPAWFAREAAAAERANSAGRVRKYGANDQINVGAIGVGGSKGMYRQGLNDARAIAGSEGVKVVAVCDLDNTHLDEAAVWFEGCSKHHDYREVLARKDIDAVVIGTPDHWHIPIALAALKAGKDVYCEKPLTLTIDEGKRLTQAMKSSRRIFQVGSQQRSDKRFRMACELVRNGRIGKLKRVNATLGGAPTGGPFAAKPVPADFDWNFWLGQTPDVPYVTERSHATFRWWLEYSGGMMTDWGAHHNDIAQWGMGTDRSGPVSVQAYGVGPVVGEQCYNVFPKFDVYHTYENGVVLNTRSEPDPITKEGNGVTFEGEGGWIFVNRGSIKASDPKLLEEPLGSDAIRLYMSTDHQQNFIDGIRTRKPCICDAEIGHRSASLCHLGNISLRLGGRKLQWDPNKEVFVGDAEANTYLKREPRKAFHALTA